MPIKLTKNGSDDDFHAALTGLTKAVLGLVLAAVVSLVVEGIFLWRDVALIRQAMEEHNRGVMVRAGEHTRVFERLSEQVEEGHQEIRVLDRRVQHVEDRLNLSERKR